jgi:hypothetical protein
MGGLLQVDVNKRVADRSLRWSLTEPSGGRGGARPTIYRCWMPVRLEDAAEIVSATLIVYVEEIESASVFKVDAWAIKWTPIN